MPPLIEIGLTACCEVVAIYVVCELFTFLPTFLQTDWFFSRNVLRFRPLPSVLQFRRRAIFKYSLAHAKVSPIARVVIWLEITKSRENLNVVLPKWGHVKDPWFVIGRVVIVEERR